VGCADCASASLPARGATVLADTAARLRSPQWQSGALGCCGCGSRLALQMGQTASTLSHEWMQSLWNKCPQLRVMTGWPASYSQQQIAQQSAQGRIPGAAFGSTAGGAWGVALTHAFGLHQHAPGASCSAPVATLQWRSSCTIMHHRDSTLRVDMYYRPKKSSTHLL
jgi:hypothetical protein